MILPSNMVPTDTLMASRRPPTLPDALSMPKAVMPGDSFAPTAEHGGSALRRARALPVAPPALDR